ncbi:MAG: DUF192 domain-containing protein, partial [Pseudomonadota bacterium]
MVRYATTALGLVALAACSPAESTSALAQAPDASAPEKASVSERHPTSGLEIIDVAIVSGDERIVFRSEHANTPEAQARGLMFRTEIADDEGMLFPSDEPALRSFW